MANKNRKKMHEDLGSRYISEFYHSAYFRHENSICKLLNVRERGIEIERYDLAAPAVNDSWTLDLLPINTLEDFSSFKYPNIGYREIPIIHGALTGHNAVVYITTRRSATRGLRDDGISMRGLPIYEFGLAPFDDPVQLLNRTQRIRSIFAPQYTPWEQGLKRLLRGEIAGFAASENVAVGISITSGPDRSFDIYFKERVVGSVSTRGDVELNNKVVQRFLENRV